MKIRGFYLIITTIALIISILFGTLSIINSANINKLKNTEFEYTAQITESEQQLIPVKKENDEK